MQRKKKAEEEKEKKRLEAAAASKVSGEKERRRKEIEQHHKHKDTLKDGITVAEEILKEVNDDLGKHCEGKTIDTKSKTMPNKAKHGTRQEESIGKRSVSNRKEDTKTRRRRSL